MDEIEFYTEVFDPKFCTYLLKDARANLAGGREFARSNHHWRPEIVRASQTVLVRDYGRELSALILDQLIARGMIETREFSVMGYAWSRLSYIPWHNDGSHRVAITIYLNEEWDCDWGGVFLYKAAADGEICGYVPCFNTGLKNSGNLEHSTTLIAPDAEAPRFTIQMFSKGG